MTLQVDKPPVVTDAVHVNNISFQRRQDGAAICVPKPPERRTVTIEENLFEDGYDSDCNQGPFYDAVNDEVDIEYYTEDIIEGEPIAPLQGNEAPSIPAEDNARGNESEDNAGRNEMETEPTGITPSIPTEDESTENTPAAPPIDDVPPADSDVPATNTPTGEEAPSTLLTEEAVRQLKVPDLKAALVARGLSRKGLKSVLVERLVTAVQTHTPLVTLAPGESTATIPNPEDGWIPGSRWKELTLDKDNPLEDVTPAGMRAPTVNRNSTAKRTNYNYREIFDRPVFKARSPVWERTKGKNPRVRLDGRGNPRYFSKARINGRTDVKWIEENKLNDLSPPSAWVDALMKMKVNDYLIDLISVWTSWTNSKATLSNIGLGGKYSQGTFKPFQTQEIKKFLGLLILNGLNISPRVEYKFKSQHNDPVNGSDLIFASFGENAINRYKLFKLLFAVQDPMIPVPPRKNAPNHKVDHFFSHILNVSAEAFEPGRNLSSDEQDASFQGRHEDKARVTFKRAGDGFLIDALCEDGYTYSFYPRNTPPSQGMD